jgi:hypothetical protein
MRKLILCLAALGITGMAAAQQTVEQVTSSVNTAYAGNNITITRQAADQDDDAVRVRNLTKTFPAERSDKINLSNQFGSMVIKVWDRKEVKIDISIRVNSSNEKRAQEFLDQVNIDAEKTGGQITCRTEIDRDNNWLGRNKQAEVKVSYVAYVPSSNALTVSQQFGNMTIGDYSGPLSATVQYGNLIAGKLSDDNNYISLQYGKGDIEELNKATIKQQYGSGLTIGTVAELTLNAQYAAVNITTIRGNAVIKQQYGSGLKIGSVNNLELTAQYANVDIGNIKGAATIKQQYNSIQIESAGKLSLKAQYAGVTIGSLKGDGDIGISYNQFNVAELGAGCKNLNINSTYANVSLGFATSYSGEFMVQKSYGNFKYSSNTKVRLSDDSDEDNHSTSKTYVGKIGNGGTSNIVVKANYGSVSFK